MFSCLQILEAFLWFVLITLLNVTLIILTLSVSRLLNLLLRLVAFLLFLNPQFLASISRWITASSSWNRFFLFVCGAFISLIVLYMLTAIRFLLFLNPQCLASISRWITASSSWKRFCLFVCRALSSIMVICMLTAIRLLLTFVMSLYLLLRS